MYTQYIPIYPNISQYIGYIGYTIGYTPNWDVLGLETQHSASHRDPERWLADSAALRGFKKSLVRCFAGAFQHPAHPTADCDSGKQQIGLESLWYLSTSLWCHFIPRLSLAILYITMTTSLAPHGMILEDIESEVLHGFRLSILLYLFPAFRLES